MESVPVSNLLSATLRRSGAAVLATLVLAGAVHARQSPGTQRAEALLGGSGAFLAAMSAQGQHDMRAAAGFYRDLLRADPGNRPVLERAFIAELADGNLPEAFRLAEQVTAREGANPLAYATLAVRALKNRQYQSARTLLGRASGGRGRTTDLTVALLTAWAHVGSGDLKKALEIVDRFSAPELAAYRNFFGGLMAEVARKPEDAQKRLTVAYRTEPGTLRVADAYARHISRAGEIENAIKVYGEWDSRNAGQPFVRNQLTELRAGRPLPPLAQTVQQGAAEVLYGLGAVGNSAREAETSLVFMQLAAYLNPEDELVQVTIAELFEQIRQWERSGDVFAKIPATSPFRIRSLLGTVISFERRERTDDAITSLTTLLAEKPDELEAVDMLAGLYRSKKKYAESIAVYSKALNRIDKPQTAHWNLFFGRGVAFERNKEWTKGEPDFLKALDLLPATVKTAREKYERAQVLNYLAYSWVDQGLNIEKSFDMLKEAVSLAPEDGAIVDSLGWAYYRLGKYGDAVKQLERAIELKPGDPTINDHLGDAYWKIGRVNEAYFKWNHARDLKPEPDELVPILRKIQFGLDEIPPPPIPRELLGNGPDGFPPPPPVITGPPVPIVPEKGNGG